MNKRFVIHMMCLLMMISVFSVNAKQKTPMQKSGEGEGNAFPVAVAKQPRWEFKPVLDGTVVTHEFIIGNRGNAPLNIERVKTSCGCTTADYSKVIAPGSEGKVAIKANTAGYGGNTFSKTITVYTNDPKNKEVKLYITGAVESFVLIEPQRVFLSGTIDGDIASEVTLTQQKKYPFSIKNTYAEEELNGKVSYALEDKNGVYILTIKNLLKSPGRYRGRIILETDSSVEEQIKIYVTGMIKDSKK